MDGTVGPISLLQFLKYDMKKALIRKIILPPLAQEEIKLKTFKASFTERKFFTFF